MGLTGFVIIHVFIASFSPAQGEHNQVVNTKFTRPVNEMPMSSWHQKCLLTQPQGLHAAGRPAGVPRMDGNRCALRAAVDTDTLLVSRSDGVIR